MTHRARIVLVVDCALADAQWRWWPADQLDRWISVCFRVVQLEGCMRMWSKKTSGLIGMTVGSIWFLMNVRHFSEQGFVAVGMPIIIIVLGFIYFRKGGSGAE